MKTTNSHIDSISRDENVWVTQGKTDHMATYVGNPHKTVYYPDSEDESRTTASKNNPEAGTEVLEVQIRWASTGNTAYVSAASVRSMVVGQRRRRQCVNLYTAVPSQRPKYNKKKKRGKNGSDNEEKEPPKAAAIEKKRRPMLRETVAEPASKSTSTPITPLRMVTPSSEAAGTSNSNDSHSEAEEPREAHNADSPWGGNDYELPTEEFHRCQEIQSIEQETKAPDPEARREEREGGDDSKQHPSPSSNNNFNTGSAPSNTRRESPGSTDRGRVDIDFDDSAKSRDAEYVPSAAPSMDDSSTKTSTHRSAASREGSLAKETPPLSVTLPGTGDLDNDDESLPAFDAGIPIDPEIHRVLEDPNHIIERGFRWEWEGRKSMNRTHQKQMQIHQTPSTRRPVPKNYGRRKPQTWNEGYSMMMEFKRRQGSRRHRFCDIPDDHPLLGKFVAGLRSEYNRFKEHGAAVWNQDNESNGDHKNTKSDMFRLDWSRIRMLRKLSFRWHAPGESDPESFSYDNDAILVDSEIENDNHDDDIENGKDITNNSRKISRSYSADTAIDSDHDDDDYTNDGGDDGCDYDDDADLIALASSSKKRDKKLRARGLADHVKDHANDEEIFKASNITDIIITDNCCSNKDKIQFGKPALPIELYRLLRISTLQPELGFHKSIRWTNDGNGIHLLDEERFTKEVLVKCSKMSKTISFRNALGQFQFLCMEKGLNKNGSDYRIYEHRSISKAREANDPSLRLFYRGVRHETIRAIKTRKEERRNGLVAHGDCKATNHSTHRKQRKRKRNIDTIWSDVDYYISNGERLSGSGRRAVDRSTLNLEQGCNTNIATRTNNLGETWNEDRYPNRNRQGVIKKQPSPPICRRMELQTRRTSDGCLHPKGSKDSLLQGDGTYEKPRGAHPHGLLWDKIRGLWAPPHLVQIKPAEDTQPTSKSSGEESDHHPSKRRTTFHFKKFDSLVSINDGNRHADDERYIEGSNNHNNNKRTRGGQDASKRSGIRWTSDGCLLPKNEPIRKDDGTYMKPKGHQPKDLYWDEMQAVWAPKGRKKRKMVGKNNDKSPSWLPRASDPSEKDPTIIKASKAKLFHHSSSIFRSFFQPKKLSSKHRDHPFQKRFQARTKSNPTGLVSNSINLSNWRKIERLMQRSSKSHSIAKVSKVAVDTGLGMANEDGEVRLV